MNIPALPLSTLHPPRRWWPLIEKLRYILHLSSWLPWPTAVWLAAVGELRLLAAGLLGAALMPLVLQMLLVPAHLLARALGRARVLLAATMTALALAAWTLAAATPVLEREHLPLGLRALWAYCVAVLPLAMTAAAHENSFVCFVSAAQVQLGVLCLTILHSQWFPGVPPQAPIILLAVAAAWVMHGAWSNTHSSTAR
ncbi:MAG: hypothetical protein AAB036_09045 [Elusimicrobiota bacterium]